MKPDPKQPTPDVPPAPIGKPPVPLSPELQGFIKAIAPKGDGPATELTQRFQASSRQKPHGMIFPNPPKDSTAYFVELRIREWMLRKEREDAEARRISEQQQNKNRPPRPGA